VVDTTISLFKLVIQEKERDINVDPKHIRFSPVVQTTLLNIVHPSCVYVVEMIVSLVKLDLQEKSVTSMWTLMFLINRSDQV